MTGEKNLTKKLIRNTYSRNYMNLTTSYDLNSPLHIINFDVRRPTPTPKLQPQIIITTKKGVSFTIVYIM